MAGRHDPGMRILVEGFEPDAIAVARLLSAEDHDVRLAGSGAAPPAAKALAAMGVAVEENADLDADPGTPDAAYVDVWTPETSSRARRLRAAGAALTCLSDLVLERAAVPTLGVTGTAGKSTTTSFAVQLLRVAGVVVGAGTTGRAGNLWATEELVPDLGAEELDVLALELTSSHLCYMRTSPTIAVVTSFWPDHLELHGGLERYRAAKETIARYQRAGDRIVVNADDVAARSFATLTPAQPWSFSTRDEVERGAFVRDGAIVARTGAHDHVVGEVNDLHLDGVLLPAALGALAIALAYGLGPAALAPGLSRLEPLPFRAHVVGRLGDTVLVDDSLAATPTKTATTLSSYDDGAVVLVAGGERASAGLAVHASDEEHVLLEGAFEEVARASRRIVAFGPAAEPIRAGLRPGRPDVEEAESIDAAIRAAVAARGDAAAVVVSPMFPLPLEDRLRVAELLRAAASSQHGE